MDKDTTYNVTEWEWLKLQLQLYSLYVKSEMYSVFYSFDFYKEGEILCSIYAKQTQKMIEEKAVKEKQLEYYNDWAIAEKNRFLNILEKLPVLKKRFDTEKDLKFEIMYSCGMSASIICEIVGSKISWMEEA